MVCPHCQSPSIRNLNRTTDLGYAVFRCGGCGRKSNERTGTPFNFLEFPTDIVFEIVLCRLLYKLSLRNLAQMFLLRGFEFTHEAVREWEERFTPLLAEHIRRKRKGKAGRRWYVDETYLKVKGKWCYLYARLTTKAIWSIRCSAQPGISLPPSASFAALSPSSPVHRSRSPPMGMIPIHARSAKCSARGPASVQCVPEPPD